jgi:predicted enzyme related to lactoylglutathione lyase
MKHGIHGIGWFEVGTSDPATAERFYGDVFGWTVTTEAGDPARYRMITTPAADSIQGGLFDHEGQAPDYAIFYVTVADVAAASTTAQAAGGKVLVPAQTTPAGLTFAHLLDPAGNHFGVFSEPPGGED